MGEIKKDITITSRISFCDFSFDSLEEAETFAHTALKANKEGIKETTVYATIKFRKEEDDDEKNDDEEVN